MKKCKVEKARRVPANSQKTMFRKIPMYVHCMYDRTDDLKVGHEFLF